MSLLSDPIADFITRIRNAQRVSLSVTSSPYSRTREHIAQVLVEEGYIRNYKVSESSGKKNITVELKYFEGKPVISKINRVSKPGRRVYSAIADLKKFANGLGINILSTSKGVLSDSKAKELGVGGEVLCQVY